MNQETVERKKVRMFGRIDAFIKAHSSTSTESSRSVSDQFQELEVQEVRGVLMVCGIPLLKKMPKKDWKAFRKAITKEHRGKPERGGVHPRLKQILDRACEGTAYSWKYEKSETDAYGIVSIADFSLYHESDMCHRTTVLEAKIEKDMIRAQQQAEGYKVSDLRDDIEMCGTFTTETNYFGVCLSSDGIELGLSAISISLDKFRIDRSYTDGSVKLWSQKKYPK